MLTAVASCTETQRPDPSTAEVRGCIAQGGYQSRGPFGEQFCQFRYSDGGKNCTGKADCQGECLSFAPDDMPLGTIPAGTLVAGHCAAERSVFGCYGLVEHGKLVDGYGCFD
jgi:hypothetical protein